MPIQRVDDTIQPLKRHLSVALPVSKKTIRDQGTRCEKHHTGERDSCRGKSFHYYVFLWTCVVRLPCLHLTEATSFDNPNVQGEFWSPFRPFENAFNIPGLSEKSYRIWLCLIIGTPLGSASRIRT